MGRKFKVSKGTVDLPIELPDITLTCDIADIADIADAITDGGNDETTDVNEHDKLLTNNTDFKKVNGNYSASPLKTMIELKKIKDGLSNYVDNKMVRGFIIQF